MILTEKQERLLKAVGAGIDKTIALMGELTDYHGDAVNTEYILTVDIAKSLMLSEYGDVSIEYRINKVKHSIFRNDQIPFALGNRRFDIVVLNPIIADFVVEVKIGVVSMNSGLKKDLNKIILYLKSLYVKYAKKVLGVCVFQIHFRPKKSGDLYNTKTRIRKIEENIFHGLDLFKKENPKFEFGLRSFQENDEGIFDDEITEDVDGTPMLGRLGHATRYHAIILRLDQ